VVGGECLVVLFEKLCVEGWRSEDDVCFGVFELRGVVGVILGLLLSVLRGSVLRVVECV
jgi:hypothetical protein